MGINLEAASYRLRYLTWICFPIFIRLIWKNARRAHLNGFLFLFNVADEIVTDRNAGIAYQEGNNRGVYPLYGKPQQGVFQRNTGNLSGNPEKSKRSDRH